MLRNRTGSKGGHALRYKGCHSFPAQKILLPLVRGIGIKDTAEIENISIKKLCR
ncbi:MAG: hypothetical protein LBL90_01765 [Prevotellaceae bacterium]|nr:hypothetical protein [Prevotellaceae bacterium]